MPKLGADMTEGKLVAWRKSPGDIVHRGDILAEIDTDKGVIDVESFAEGVLEVLLAQPGDIVPVGAALARLRAADARPCVASATAVPLAAEHPMASELPSTRAIAMSSAAESKTEIAPSLLNAETRRVRISPSARRLASELGVDISTVVGSGPESAITREDVQHAKQAGTILEASPSGALGVGAVSTPASLKSVDRNARMRSAIATAMTRSNREIPHYYLSTTIDFKKVLDWLTQQNDQRKVTDRLLYGVILLKATAMALREVPELNAFWQDEQLHVQSSIHLGVAISLRGGGLVAPALHDVDRKSLDVLMVDFRDLVQRARTGKLRSSELSNQTITLTSLGEQGVESVFGVIYPPQVALVGFGKVVERPWCVDGRIVPRPLLTATLAGDHRATDGHRGGVFLTVLDGLLQEPEKL
jgi:pyruvate dehydrogenase E2 component (dihydrolipoamide acetyltransferase)